MQEVRITRVLDAVSLQGAEVIGIAEFHAQPFKDSPVTALSLGPECLCEMPLQVGDDPIVVEQGVVDIQQEDDGDWLHHRGASKCFGLYQPPSAAISVSASFGPQLWRR